MNARCIAVLAPLSLLLSLAFVSLASAEGEEPSPEAKPWDQAAMQELTETFAKQSRAAYTAVYTQGATSAQLGSGNRREYFRLRDRVRVIDREAKHLSAAIADGKGLDETFPIFERLMVEVRDARVLGRRVMIQESTAKSIETASDTLRKIGDYYDPSAFERGPAPPLGQPQR